MSSKKARVGRQIGEIGGKAGIEKNIKRDSQITRGVHVKPTGPDEEGAQHAPEDLYPHRLKLGPSADANERLRDEISMVRGGLYGEDALGGVRPYNRKMQRKAADAFYNVLLG